MRRTVLIDETNALELARTALINVRTALINVGTALINARTALINVRTALINVGTALINVGSALINARSALINAGSTLINARTALINVGTALINAGSALINARSALINVGSVLINARSTLKYGRSACTLSVLRIQRRSIRQITDGINLMAESLNQSFSLIASDSFPLQSSLAISLNTGHSDLDKQLLPTIKRSGGTNYPCAALV